LGPLYNPVLEPDLPGDSIVFHVISERVLSNINTIQDTDNYKVKLKAIVSVIHRRFYSLTEKMGFHISSRYEIITKYKGALTKSFATGR
jgi:hypothetical protein